MNSNTLIKNKEELMEKIITCRDTKLNGNINSSLLNGSLYKYMSFDEAYELGWENAFLEIIEIIEDL